MQMSFARFKNSLEQKEEYGVYLFEGEEGFLRDMGADALIKKYVAFPDLDLCVVVGDDKTTDEIIALASSYPFASEKRVTLIKEFYPDKNELKDGSRLNGFLQSPPDFGVFIIVNEKPCENLKKIPSVCVVNCVKQDERSLAIWIKNECLSQNVAIDMQSAATLAEYCLCDMLRIGCERTKLCDMVGDGGTITAALIEDNVARDNEYKIYEMTEHIGRKRVNEALKVVYDMLSKGETYQRIIISVYNYFRRLLHIAISTESDARLAEMLGVKEYAVKKAREQSKLFKTRALKKAVDSLADGDYFSKSGRADADSVTWLNLFKIMTEE